MSNREPQTPLDGGASASIAGPGIAWCGGTEGIYFASKTKHAPRWKALRDSGVRTASTWIDEAGEGQTADYSELSERCLNEIADATVVLLYCEPGELLKGALVEVGAALMMSTPVLCVGTCDSLSRVFRKHPQWREFQTVEDALAAIPNEKIEGSPPVVDPSRMEGST